MKILVSSLEPSANLHLGEILKREKFDMVGIFDEKFGKPIYSSREFSVMGFFDVLPKIFKAKKAISELAILSKTCNKVLLIDAPSFNIPLAKAIKKINPNIEIIYYILPKVWAWKKGRISTVNKFIDTEAYIFPFEKEYWKKGEYVGNPLLDEIKQFRDDKNYGNVAFLAGSRKSEIKSLMPIFRELKSRINKKAILVVPEIYKNSLEIYENIEGFEVVYNTQEALLKSDFAYICSGTATLESAIIGTPFVLMYKARKLEYFIAKRFVKLDFVGLANIIFQKAGKEEFHKEFLQEFNVEELLEEYFISSLSDSKLKRELLLSILRYGSSDNLLKLLKSDIITE